MITTIELLERLSEIALKHALTMDEVLYVYFKLEKTKSSEEEILNVIKENSKGSGLV